MWIDITQVYSAPVAAYCCVNLTKVFGILIAAADGDNNIIYDFIARVVYKVISERISIIRKPTRTYII